MKSTLYTGISLFIFLFLGYWGNAQAGLLKLNIGSAMGEKGTRVCLDVTAENFKNIESIQFNLSYNASLIVPECPATYVHPSLKNNIFGEIFNCNAKENGYLNFVWASGATTIPDNEIIFTLCFNIVGDPGNVSSVFFNGLILQVEVCSLAANNATVCSEKLNTNIGSIIIKSNSLRVLHSKCDADGINNIENASLTFYGTGGTPPYSYTVTPGGFSGTLPADGQRFKLSNIPQGTYNINITDNTGIMATSGPIVVTNSFPITYDTPIIKSPTCFNRKNGSIEIPNTNGVSPFRYEWSNFISGINTFNKISNLDSGKYKVTITDSGGCAKVDSFTLFVDTLKVKLTVDKSASCNQPQVRDGGITIETSGGTSYKNGLPYEYSLNGNNWIRFASPTSLTNMPTGNLTLRVRDTLFCTSELISANIPFDRTIDMTFGKQDISCFGLSDGSVKITASPYSTNYTFFPVTGFPDLGVTRTDTFSVGGLTKGTYRYRLIDVNGCRDTVEFTINEPTVLGITQEIIQPSCTTDGSITLNPTGGTGPYNYTWDPPSGNVNRLNNLTGGTFRVTVTDINGCSKNDVMTLNPKGSISINALATKQVSCFSANDAILFVDISAPITSGPFNVSWKNAAGVEVSKSQTVNNIGPGVYSVAVSDKDGCSNSAQNITVTQPAPITFSASVSNAACFQSNGIATITISGNPTGYKYEWRKKDSLTVIDTDNILDAKAGAYSVKVIHPNNCTKDTTIIITEPSKITFPTPETRNVFCFGLSTGQAAIIGAPAGITFSWSSGTVGPFATNFPEGRAWVLGSLATCKSDTVFFNVGTFPRLTIDSAKTIKTQPLCFGSANGSLKVEALGGTSIGYNYSWANGTTGSQLNNIAAGVYKVTITDSNNCTYADSITLDQPTRMIPMVDPLKTVELNCKNRDAGKIGLQVSGGNPGKKTITWQSGILTDNEVAIGLSTGRYCATVTDNFGCSETFCYQLADASPLIGKIKTPAAPLCNGGKTCIAVDFIRGGTGNKYTFQLNNGTRFPIDTCIQVFAGQYFINLIDSAGCSIDTTITINQPDPISVDLGPDLDVQLGTNSPTIRVSINSPAGIANVIWSPTEGIECIVSNCFSVQANPTTTTTYKLTATDQNGCTGSDEITINVKNIRNVFFPNIFSPNRDGVNDHFQAITGPGVEKIINFVIFDRWGNKVFEKYNYVPDPTGTDGWDGTYGGRALDPGVYVYYSLARFNDGKDIEYSGSVTLTDKVRN